MSKEQKNLLAKLIRIFAIPPTFVVILATVMFFTVPDTYRHVGDLLVTVTSLAIIPALAYPLAAVLPKFKARGRAGSRALAFVTSAAGYTVGTLYAFLSGATPELKFIFSGYMIALIALTVFNKVFKLKASGHACGILGPLLYAVHFFGINWIIPCSVAAVAVVWASLYRKSHTPKELALGALCAAVGFFVGLI